MHRSLAAAALVWALAASTSLDLAAQQFQFAAPAPRQPTSLLPLVAQYFGYAVVDDLDGDGHSDVIATFQNQFGVFRGSASGLIVPPLSMAWSGQRPVLVDLEGDGDRDLAWVPPHLSLLRPIQLYANSAANLNPVVLPAGLSGVAVQGAAVGDVDGNGFADLVIAVPSGSVTPSIVLARGGGPGLQFTLDLTATPAGLPFALWPELFDADGDGDLDVLATNTTSGLRLLRNTGGTFTDATASLPATPMGHSFLAAADFDGDGRGDCAAIVNGDIDVLWGAPGGLVFARAVAHVNGAQHLSPADFDGDGDGDLLVDGPDGLDVLWNLGNRQFARTNLARSESALRGVGDLDRDGRDDVVFSLWNDTAFVRCKYRATLEDTALLVGVPPPPLMAAVRGAALAGDVDGDGRTDLVTAGVLATVVDRALGGGVYAQSTSPINLTANVLDVRSELADMDGDGDPDLVVKTDAQLTVARNNGGAFAAALQIPSTVRGTSWGIPNDDLRVADMDGDGDRDIVIADVRGAMLVRNLGAGQFAPPVVVVAPTPSPRCVEVADVDGDGDRDVICDAVASSGLTHVIAANDGTGTFAPRAGFYVNLGIEPTSVRAADLDGDGDADLLVADSDLRVYRNDGTGFFADRTPFDVPGNLGQVLTNVVVADVDDDGDLDVAALRSSATPALLLLNDGSGRLSDRSVARVEQPSVGLASGMLRAADLDDDGDPDLAIAVMGQREFLVNHLRQCRCTAAPRLGGIAAFDLVSGPGFGQPGLAALGVAAAVAAPPLHLPGLRGQFDLDGSTLQMLALVTTSSIGVSTVFVPVPPQAALFGAAVWFQGAVLPASDPPGFTNAIHEVVLR